LLFLSRLCLSVSLSPSLEPSFLSKAFDLIRTRHPKRERSARQSGNIIRQIRRDTRWEKEREKDPERPGRRGRKSREAERKKKFRLLPIHTLFFFPQREQLSSFLFQLLPPARSFFTMHVQKRDGRKEAVHFDKITARITKLAYGLSAEFCDPVRRERSFRFFFEMLAFNARRRRQRTTSVSPPSFLALPQPNRLLTTTIVTNELFSAIRERQKRHLSTPKCPIPLAKVFSTHSPTSSPGNRQIEKTKLPGSRRPEGRDGRLQGRHYDRAR